MPPYTPAAERQQDDEDSQRSCVDRERLPLRLKRFFVLSACFHLILLACIYVLPAQQDAKKKEDLFARLVSPEEFAKLESKPPPPVIVPPQPPRIPRTVQPPRRAKAMPEVSRTPLVPAVPPPLTEEKPVVPGEGRETGRQLPAGAYPRAGTEERAGRKGGAVTPVPGRPSESGPLEREKLFDPGIIGDLARKDTEKFPRKENAITFDTSEYRYKGYMRKLKEKIENIWVYPPEARVKGIYGDLKIRFTIRKDGRLGAIELVRTSGYRMLDEAAMRALKDGEPYWPLPDEWGMDSYTIVGHFIYSLGGYYLR